MKTRLIMALFANIIIASPCFSLTFEETIALYINKDYQQAYQSFNELAALGNTKAQFNIAVMYARGEAVKVDLIEAAAWAMLAGDNQEQQASSLISILSAKLDPAALEKVKSRLSELQAELSNEVIVQQLVPTYNAKGAPVVNKLEAKAPRYPKDKLAIASFGVVEVTGMVDKEGSVRYPSVLAPELGSFEKVSLNAFKKFKYSPATIDNIAAGTFGVRNRFVFQIADTRLRKKSLQAYLDQLKLTAEEGSSIEKFVYAKQISSYQAAYKGTTGYEDINWGDSFDWMYKSAQDGVALAKFELGLAPLTGDQCAQNMDQSLYWLQSAAKDGIADAKLILGYEYIHGKRCQKDETLGFEYLSDAAQVIDHGKVLLAWLYATHPKKSFINYTKSETLLAQVDEKSYSDLRSYYETKAAIAIGLNNSKQAKKALKKLAKQNRKLDTPRTREHALNAALLEGEPYSEAL